MLDNARVSGIPNLELTPEIAARLPGAFGPLIGPTAYVVTRAIRIARRA